MAVAGTLEIDVVLNGKKVKNGIDELKKRMGLLNKSAKSTTKIFGKLAKFASIGFLAKMTIDATRFGRSMSLIADRTGIATEKLMGMRTAFSAMGGKASDVDKLIGSISKGLAGVSMGKGEFASKLASMGISAWGTGGKIKSADMIMGDIADWTRQQLTMGYSNEEVASFLEDNFGIGYEMFKNLALGRSGMAQRQAQLNSETGSISGKQIENLNSFYQVVSKLKTTFDVLANQVAGTIAPIFEFLANVIQYISKEFQDVFTTATDVFKELFGSSDECSQALSILKDVIHFCGEAFRFLLEALRPLVGGIRYVSETLGSIVAWLVNKFKWIFGTSANEKWQTIANEQALQASKKLGAGEFKNIDEMMKWLNDTKNPVWQKKYQEYMLSKDKHVDEFGNKIDINSIPLVGDEVMTASSGDGGLTANVSVENNFVQNGDGTITADTTTTINGAGDESTTKTYNIINGS